MIEYVIVFLLLFFYSHLYLHFLVNPNNECSIVTNLTKEEISDHVYTKQPFLLDATLFRPEIRYNDSDTSNTVYEPMPLLEPYVKFYPHKKRIGCAKKKKWVETNDACRTFYRVDKGSFQITCIHPSQTKENPLKSIKKWKKNEDLIQLTLHEDSLLFLPKDWYIYIEALEDSKIEIIQYYTPLNLLANSISKILKYIGDTITICSMKERPFI